jgi:hypothetical protein
MLVQEAFEIVLKEDWLWKNMKIRKMWSKGKE